jgi:bifunctional non-homologous end joining protein LigD
LGVVITHPERIIFEDVGLTKADLAEYYSSVAVWMLPHLAERPLSLLRCPEGARKTCFYQKHPPMGLPDSVHRVDIREKSGMDTYLWVSDAEGLVTLIQFGALEIHCWGSRIDRVEQPDRLIFDLDPGPKVAWSDVIAAAVMFRDVLRQLELESFIKTTGGKGLHVVVPIARRAEWPAMKSFCQSLVQLIAEHAPDRFTTNVSKAARPGKIFLDYLRNDRGSTAVAPYSCRARVTAPVAMPIRWEDLKNIKSGGVFTVRSALDHLRARRGDPWAEMSKVRQGVTQKTLQRIESLPPSR